MTGFIPVNEPLLNGNEKKYLDECISTGWISSEGQFVKEFEKTFALRIGRKHGIALTNGSAALEVAIAALNIGVGDEVILPTFTIISCASAIIRAGATPIVVDSDSRNWNMDVGKIEERITPKTRAIMAVHIYGLPNDMDPILDLADKYNLKIIEDAAEAHGLTHRGRPCGSFGDISTFSFYPNKLVTTGEGGMVLTDDTEVAERCRSLINLCFQPKKRFVHEELGWNFRMSNVQAAIGVAQLERYDTFISKKKHVGKLYTALLSDTPGIQLPLTHTNYAENIFWIYGIVLDDEVSFDANGAIERMAKRKIGTRPFFWPMHKQPIFRKMGLFSHESYPVAERLARRGFYLPSGMTLTDEQIERAALSLKEILI